MRSSSLVLSPCPRTKGSHQLQGAPSYCLCVEVPRAGPQHQKGTLELTEERKGGGEEPEGGGVLRADLAPSACQTPWAWQQVSRAKGGDETSILAWTWYMQGNRNLWGPSGATKGSEKEADQLEKNHQIRVGRSSSSHSPMHEVCPG